jgi:hypothetical protein
LVGRNFVVFVTLCSSPADQVLEAATLRLTKREQRKAARNPRARLGNGDDFAIGKNYGSAAAIKRTPGVTVERDLGKLAAGKAGAVGPKDELIRASTGVWGAAPVVDAERAAPSRATAVAKLADSLDLVRAIRESRIRRM